MTDGCPGRDKVGRRGGAGDGGSRPGRVTSTIEKVTGSRKDRRFLVGDIVSMRGGVWYGKEKKILCLQASG